MRTASLTIRSVWPIAIALIAAACRDGRRDTDAALAFAQQPVSTQTTAPSFLLGATQEEPYTAAFRAAAACPECQVVHSAPLHLPETGVAARSAKLLRPNGVLLGVTIDPSTGAALDENTILQAEHAAVARYGKLQPVLYRWLATASPDSEAWIWVELASEVPRERREALLADKKLAEDHNRQLAKSLDAARAPVSEWLSRSAGASARADEGGSIIRAKLKARFVRHLELLPQVARLGTDEFPGKPNGDLGGLSAWNDSLRLAEAHRRTLGAGQSVCVKEAYEPDSYSRIPLGVVVADRAMPGISMDSHTRLTTAIIRNTDAAAAPWNCVAPQASLYIANWWGYSGTGGINQWCRDRYVTTLSYSWSMSGQSASAAATLSGTEIAHDWLAPNSPYILVVASAGKIDPYYPSYDYVANKNFNGLVVGGVDDRNTADRSDDVADTTVAWRNPATYWGDYELPHVVAPSNGTSVALGALSGPSAATAMVSGVSALVGTQDWTLNSWPEEKRAIIIATATARAGATAMTQLGGTDRRVGAGEVDAAAAVDLASVSWKASYSGGTLTEYGHLARGFVHAADFDASTYFSTVSWKAKIEKSGRLRVVMTWDAMTQTCSDATNCTTGALDADLDLYVWRKPSGSDWSKTGTLYTSSSYNSSWEMVDIPVVAGEEVLIAPRRYSYTTSMSYVGLAWFQYRLPSGELCTENSACASGVCTAGRCACLDSSGCFDGKTCSLQACGTCGGNGQACCDGTTVPSCDPNLACVGGTCQPCSGCDPGVRILPAKSSFLQSEPVTLRVYLPNISPSACSVGNVPAGVLTIQSLTRDGVVVSPAITNSGFIEAGPSMRLSSVPGGKWLERSWTSAPARTGAVVDSLMTISRSGDLAYFNVDSPGSYVAQLRYIPPRGATGLCSIPSQAVSVSFTIVGG